MALIETIDTRWFPTKREAEQYAKAKLGKPWRYWSLVEPAGFHRKAGWYVRVFRPIQSAGS